MEAVPETSRGPVVDFDHHSADFNADPHAGWQSLRRNCPVAWSEHYGGFWIVADYEGNHEVLKNYAVFTTERIGPGTSLNIPSYSQEGGLRALPLELDPPRHGPVRQLLNARLSPGASKALQPTIEHWTTTCIDAVIEAGACDLLYDITTPVPAYTTLDWLGFPHERILEAAERSHDVVGYPPGSERWNRAMDSNMIEQTLWETCAARRDDPRDDMISWLMTQELNGQPLDDRTIVEVASLLIAGGVDTTTSLTSSALVHLNRDRALRQRLIDDPELVVKATEEFLRLYPPVTSNARTAREDFELRGCEIRSGDPVLVSRYAANYDDAAFDRPEEFIVDRFPNRHVSFGLGPHRCVGSHLGRLMFQVMMRQILQRMPDYEIDEDRISPYPDRGIHDGWAAMPTRFSPGPRIDAQK
jgi:cytochrome P450